MGVPTLTDPYAIFARARQYLEAARYPAQLSYGVTVTVTKRGKSSIAHYHSYYDSTLNAVRVIAESDEELAQPYKPHGINTYLRLFPTGPEKGIPLSAPQRTFDFLGVPLLAPNYFFGIAQYVPHTPVRDDKALVEQIRREFHETPKPWPTPAANQGIKTIANIEALRRDYIMHLTGVEPVGGHSDYHLLLQPVSAPERYRLRQLWIDTQSFAVDRVITQGNFLRGGAITVSWTTTFRQIGGAPYIDSEHTDESFSIVRHAYDSATVTFTNVTAAKVPPYVWMAHFSINGDTGMPPLAEP